MGRKNNRQKIDEHTRRQYLRVVLDQNLDDKVQRRRFSMAKLSRAGESLVTLGTTLKVFLRKCPFFTACIIRQHFLTAVSTVKKTLKRQLGKRQFSWRSALVQKPSFGNERTSSITTSWSPVFSCSPWWTIP
jgi:hypothetical protein